MLDKMLELFGLVRIKKARKLTGLLHKYYAECVTNGVLEDFKVPPANNAQGKALEWWYYEFDSILQHGTENVVIITEPKFKPT